MHARSGAHLIICLACVVAEHIGAALYIVSKDRVLMRMVTGGG
jgi:cytochrome b561